MKNANFLFPLITAAALLTMPGAQAADGKSYPGSMCKSAGSGQDLYFGSYSSGSIAANRTASNQTIVCPLVRDTMTKPWTALRVTVRDRSRAKDISCQVRAYDLLGQTVFVSPTDSTAGTGFQTLTFGAGLAQSNWGPFVLSCTLPGMEANTPSYIASYVITEQ